MSTISIITISRNNLDGLVRTAASIAGQDTKDYEWIVIDGASEDGSVDFLKDSPADYISEPDAGIYDAMNKGIARAKGDYLLFLNAGDTLESAKTLALLTSEIKAHNPDFLYGSSYELSSNSQRNFVPGKKQGAKCINKTYMSDAATMAGAKFRRLFKPARHHSNIALGMFTHHQAMLYKREKLGGLTYNTNYTIAADYDLTWRFLKTAKTIHFVREPLCVFEPGGVSQTNAKLGRQEQYAIRKALGVFVLTNMMITGAQAITWRLRRAFPNLYWQVKFFARSFGNTNTGTGQNKTPAGHPKSPA